MIKKTIILILLFTPLIVFSGTSFFGLAPGSLGTIQNQGSTAAFGRGGFEIAYFDTLSLNNSNYALWPYLTRTTINLNFGYNRLSTETGSQTTASTTGNYTGGHLSMPLIQGKLAMGVGLLPLIQNNQSISYNRTGFEIDPIEQIKTTGNLSEANFIVSYALNKDLSFAAIASYNFGKITDRLSVEYNQVGYGDILIYDYYRIYGSSFSLHSFYKISENIASGLRLKFPAKLTMKTEQISRHINQFVEENREITFPFNVAAGFSYIFNDHLIAGIDFDYQNWKSGYKIDDVALPGFNDSYRISLGIENMPVGRRFVPYSQKMNYRGGLYFEQLNTKSNNNNVYEYGISAGLGLPIMTPFNRIDLAVQYGKRGNLSTNAVSENIFKINLSITAGSLWFIREDN